MVANAIGRFQRRRDERQSEVAEKPDLAVKRLGEALNQLASQNQRLEEDLAVSQAKHRQTMEDNDQLIGENRKLRATVEDLRIQCSRKSK